MHEHARADVLALTGNFLRVKHISNVSKEIIPCSSDGYVCVCNLFVLVVSTGDLKRARYIVY